MKGRSISYSVYELVWIEVRRDLPRRNLHAQFCSTFGRQDVSEENLKRLCFRKGWGTGRTGCFEKGLTPHNKGKPRPFCPRSAATQFRKGNAPANRKPLGDERVGKDGYIEIKVPVPNPYTGHATRYMHKHRWRWEQANGPLPNGMALKCLDGDRTNTDPQNWEAVPRALLPRLAGRAGRRPVTPYDAAPTELKPTLLAIAKLEHRARTAAQASASGQGDD